MFSNDVGCLHRQQPPTEANLPASHVPSPGEDTEIYLFRTHSKTVRSILIHHLLEISPGASAKKGGRRGSYELGAPRRLGGCGSEGSLQHTGQPLLTKLWFQAGVGDWGARQDRGQKTAYSEGSSAWEGLDRACEFG